MCFAIKNAKFSIYFVLTIDFLAFICSMVVFIFYTITMERKIWEHTLVLKDKLNFLDFTRLSKFADKTLSQDDMLWESMAIILLSFDWKEWKEWLQLLQWLDDIGLFNEILEAYAWAMTAITEFIEKKKK